MSFNHLALLLVVVATWGFNFVFIRIGLNDLPPLLLCAVRFIFAALPAIFFFPRPKCSWRLLAGYGLVMFACQFSFLFTAMKVGMSPGLASLIMQFQVFFTMFLAVLIFKERPSVWKVVGAIVSFSGIILVAWHTDGSITLPGLFFTLLGGFSWGMGNIISKKIGTSHPLGLVAWGSLAATPFLILVSLLLEGRANIVMALQHISLSAVFAILYIVLFSTHLAYSLWSYLLQKHPASTIAPYTLLVPVFGFLGSMLVLGEKLQAWKMEATFLVILGLGIQFSEKKLRGFLSPHKKHY